MKLEPVAVIVKEDPPVVAELGEMAARVGAGFGVMTADEKMTSTQ